MKFRLADGALETEQEAIVQRIGVINSLAVPEQGIAQGADLEQLVPVAARASEAGHLHAENDADTAQADLGHEALEPQASLRRCPRVPLVLVYHQNTFPRPPQGYRVIA